MTEFLLTLAILQALLSILLRWRLTLLQDDLAHLRHRVDLLEQGQPWELHLEDGQVIAVDELRGETPDYSGPNMPGN